MKLKNISREEQLEKLRERYVGRGSEGKTRILDEVCEQYGYHSIGPFELHEQLERSLRPILAKALEAN